MVTDMKKFLELNKIYCGYSEELINEIAPESISCSIWSPPYNLNKYYEKTQSFSEWKVMIKG
jgi:hypothetical protein